MAQIHHFVGDKDTLKEIASKAPGKLIVLDFFAEWCGPCKALGAKLPELAEKYPDVMFIKANTDENAEMCKEYNIRSIPAIKFLKYENEEVQLIAEVTGFNLQQIEEKIQANK